MPRHTQVKLLCHELAHNQPGCRATKEKLALALGWELDKVDRVIDRALSERQPLIVHRRGVIEILDERGGLYGYVREVLEDDWIPDRGLRGTARVTARGGKRGLSLELIHPDVVVEVFVRGRGTAKRNQSYRHAFEVESLSHFNIESIWQAFVQGRGADFAWVIFDRRDFEVDEPKERIVWAAKRLGVGLISYEDPRKFATWNVEREAEPLKPTVSEQKRFVRYVYGDAVLALSR